MSKMFIYPTSFQCTDSVIINKEGQMILLAKKDNEPLWRFPGGFVDPSDPSLEYASTREKSEECSIDLECSPPVYLGSFRVDDPRYRDSQDKIMSAVFVSNYIFGKPVAGDDIAYVEWFTMKYLRNNYQDIIMKCHLPIIEMLFREGYL